jgi:hypothetical protein
VQVVIGHAHVHLTTEQLQGIILVFAMISFVGCAHHQVGLQ